MSCELQLHSVTTLLLLLRFIIILAMVWWCWETFPMVYYILYFLPNLYINTYACWFFFLSAWYSYKNISVEVDEKNISKLQFQYKKYDSSGIYGWVGVQLRKLKITLYNNYVKFKKIKLNLKKIKKKRNWDFETNNWLF